MQINPLLSAQENILALLNAKNPNAPVPFDLLNVGIGAVASVTNTLGAALPYVSDTVAETLTVTHNVGGIFQDGALVYNEATLTVSGQIVSDTEANAIAVREQLATTSSIQLNVDDTFHIVTLSSVVAGDGGAGGGGYITTFSANYSAPIGIAEGSGTITEIFVYLPYNSEVTVVATANAGYSGSKVIKYNRLRMHHASGVPDMAIIDIPESPTGQQIIDAIAAQTGMVAAELRLVGFQQAATPEEMGVATVTGILGSLLYNPGIAMQQSFTTRLPQQDMNDAIADNEMDGFTAVV